MSARRQFTLKYLFFVVTALAIVFAVLRALTGSAVTAVASGILLGLVVASVAIASMVMGRILRILLSFGGRK